MNNRRRQPASAISFALVCLLSLGAADGARAEALVIGKVSDDPARHHEKLAPIVERVAARMGDLGITETRVLLARDNVEMAHYLRTGKVDWVTETAFSAVQFERDAGAEILLRRWKKGKAEYRTVIFVRSDSGIDSLADLAGHTIAFEDPGSTSAYFAPRAVLARAGADLVRLPSPRAKAAPGTVGFVFSGEEINTATWVHKKLVAAGAVSDGDWNNPGKMPADFREDMTVLHEGKALPRSLELVRGDLDPAVKARLEELLLAMEDDPDAADVLKAYDRSTRFDRLDAAGRASLAEVRSLGAFTVGELD